jgi:hypothetical protein
VDKKEHANTKPPPGNETDSKGGSEKAKEHADKKEHANTKPPPGNETDSKGGTGAKGIGAKGTGAGAKGTGAGAKGTGAGAKSSGAKVAADSSEAGGAKKDKEKADKDATNEKHDHPREHGTPEAAKDKAAARENSKDKDKDKAKEDSKDKDRAKAQPASKHGQMALIAGNGWALITACLLALCCPLTIACVLVCRGRQWCCFRHRHAPVPKCEPDESGPRSIDQPGGNQVVDLSSL